MRLFLSGVTNARLVPNLSLLRCRLRQHPGGVDEDGVATGTRRRSGDAREEEPMRHSVGKSPVPVQGYGMFGVEVVLGASYLLEFVHGAEGPGLERPQPSALGGQQVCRLENQPAQLHDAVFINPIFELDGIQICEPSTRRKFVADPEGLESHRRRVHGISMCDGRPSSCTTTAPKPSASCRCMSLVPSRPTTATPCHGVIQGSRTPSRLMPIFVEGSGCG